MPLSHFSFQKLPREYIFVVLMWFANCLPFQIVFTLAFYLSLPLILKTLAAVSTSSPQYAAALQTI